LEKLLNITDLLFDKQNSSAITQFANKFGVSEAQARDAIASLAPSVSRGLGHHAQNEIGRGGILDALKTGNHSRYLDSPDLLGSNQNRDDGNSILGHIFGNKDVSRHVTKEAAKKTGIGGTLLKKMLPVVATMVMASLGKKMFGDNSAATQQQSGGGIGGLLTQFLDKDNDGSMIDDVLGMAFKMAFK